jgi:hypothetical protein
MKLLFEQAEEVVKMMEIELGSGWIGHQHCKVHTVLLHLKNLTCNLDFDYGIRLAFIFYMFLE